MGRIPDVAANRLLLGNAAVLGAYWGGYWKHGPQLIHRIHDRLLGLLAEGEIHPLVWNRLPWERLPEGLDAIASRRVWGKVVLELD